MNEYTIERGFLKQLPPKKGSEYNYLLPFFGLNCALVPKMLPPGHLYLFIISLADANI